MTVEWNGETERDTRFFRELGIEVRNPPAPAKRWPAWKRRTVGVLAFAGYLWLIVWGATEGWKLLK